MIRIHASAERELQEAVQYYFAIDPKLAVALLDEARRIFAQIASHPFACKSIGGGSMRQCRLKKFPYVIIYEPGAQESLVVAIAHAKRKPGYWQSRR